jgi:hypothetical protein
MQEGSQLWELVLSGSVLYRSGQEKKAVSISLDRREGRTQGQLREVRGEERRETNGSVFSEEVGLCPIELVLARPKLPLFRTQLLKDRRLAPELCLDPVRDLASPLRSLGRASPSLLFLQDSNERESTFGCDSLWGMDREREECVP